jgi:hypothetical protein
MSMQGDGGKILTGETKELREKPIPMPLCPLQIPHGLTWALNGERLANDHLSHGTAIVDG